MIWTGVNICPKKSETVYPEIWGILKLSGLINQKIFETVYRNLKQSQKHAHEQESKETIVPDGEYICLSLRNACLIFSLTENGTSAHIFPNLFGPKLSVTSKNF